MSNNKGTASNNLFLTYFIQVFSPWNAFLNTLDSQPGLSNRETMDLFAKTLAVAPSTWRDSNDNTLLIHMASRNKTHIVKRLIHELYVPVNATNKDGMTALHMAAQNGAQETCSELLNSHADATLKNKNGDTAATIAQNAGHMDLFHTLKRAETFKRLFQGYNNRLSDR